MPKTGVHFPILIEVRCIVPAAVSVVEEQDITFLDVDEETDIATAAEHHKGVSVAFSDAQF